MGNIGIFWVYRGVVFGKTVPIDQGEEGVEGIIDSPVNHVDTWDELAGIKSRFPELLHVEYFEIPRGRVLWEIGDNRPIIYMDSVLFTDSFKLKTSEYFGFDCSLALWKTDVHYTTNHKRLEEIFSIN